MRDMAIMGEASASGAAPARTQALMLKVVAFLSWVFLDRPCYIHLHAFAGLFPELAQSAGCELIDEGKLVKSLALLRHDSQGAPDLRNVNVVHRTQFRLSTLYRAFLLSRVRRDMAAAKAADGANREVLLQTVLNKGVVWNGLF